MTNKISKERAFELSKRSPSLANRRRYTYTRGCQALPVIRRCLRLVGQLKQALRALEYEQRHCNQCQESLDEDEQSQPGCPIENQMAHLDTALCELQELWEACHWESDLFSNLVEGSDEDDFLSSGE